MTEKERAESEREYLNELRHNHESNKPIRIKVMQGGKCVAVTELSEWLEDNQIEQTFGIEMKAEIICSILYTGKYDGGGGAAAEYQLIRL
jgi:hypothetical protein